MNLLNISSLQEAIRGIQARPDDPQVRQIYCDHLCWVHEKIFDKAGSLFSQDFYWLAAHYPKRIGLGQDPKLAQRVLKAEQVFQKKALEQNLLEGFSLFNKHYEEFAKQVSKKARDCQDDLPFRFVLDHPRLIAWYQKALDRLLQNNLFHESFLEGSPEVFSLILQRGILELIESDVKTNPMPVFLSEVQWLGLLQMREEYWVLSADEKKALRESAKEEIPLQDQIKSLGESIVSNQRPSVSKLMHALTLLAGEE